MLGDIYYCSLGGRIFCGTCRPGDTVTGSCWRRYGHSCHVVNSAQAGTAQPGQKPVAIKRLEKLLCSYRRLLWTEESQ